MRVASQLRPSGLPARIVVRRSNGAAPRRWAASAQSSSATTTTTASAQRRQEQQLRQLQELLRETVDIALQTGPRGVFRGLQAAGAVASIVSDYAQQAAAGRPDPPQVVLRKLFERLGVTFIKLGRRVCAYSCGVVWSSRGVVRQSCSSCTAPPSHPRPPPPPPAPPLPPSTPPGQFIASTPSIFPPEYVEEFQGCLDRAAPVPYPMIRAIIAQDLGRPVEEVFSSIDERPLASASIAQVHAAVLAGSNKEVVIKVVKPGTADIIQVDLNAVR